MGRLERLWDMFNSSAGPSIMETAREYVVDVAGDSRLFGRRTLATQTSYGSRLRQDVIQRLAGAAVRVFRPLFGFVFTLEMAVSWFLLMKDNASCLIDALVKLLTGRRPHALRVTLDARGASAGTRFQLFQSGSETAIIDDLVVVGNLSQNSDTWCASQFMLSVLAEEDDSPVCVKSHSRAMVSSSTVHNSSTMLNRSLDLVTSSLGMSEVGRWIRDSSERRQREQEAAAAAARAKAPAGGRYRYAARGGIWVSPSEMEAFARSFMQVLFDFAGHDAELLHEFERQLPGLAAENGKCFDLKKARLYAPQQRFQDELGVVEMDLLLPVDYEALKKHYPQSVEMFEAMGHMCVMAQSKENQDCVALRVEGTHKMLRSRFFVKGDSLVWATTKAVNGDLEPMVGPDGAPIICAFSACDGFQGGVLFKQECTLRAPLGFSIQMPTVYVSQDITFSDQTGAVLTSRIAKIERSRADRMLGRLFPVAEIFAMLEEYYVSTMKVEPVSAECIVGEVQTGAESHSELRSQRRWLFYNDFDVRIPALPAWFFESFGEAFQEEDFQQDLEMSSNLFGAVHSDLVRLRSTAESILERNVLPAESNPGVGLAAALTTSAPMLSRSDRVPAVAL
ncbi:hypothetical protein FVE85_0675 [Porphyridium purpureum]|uniref:Uncharacterized protein n=1 Tax=Porphyridium purpureum TaxID=35688 RepID=A0A5J4Z004_PORPP|nr:hypothetical protein FVE85_0675 [Porphyridium purpureum]|eukprot:POR3716..scf208_2